MAIIENLWLRKSKKRLGGVVLYQAMEQTRARELANSVSNPRTQSQMGQRVKWSQLVAFYRANGPWMKYAYETKSPQQSEYNKFMQLNVSNSNVYMTKQQAAAGACVVMPYIMTQGSLPAIEFTAEAGSWPSNIYYPTDSSLLSTTTVAEFSQKIIAQNPAIRNGDQLSFIRFTQMTNADTGYPYVIVRTYELVFDISSQELVGSFLPLDYIGVLNVGTPKQLGVIDSGLAGGFLMCLSRTSGGKTYVSSQRIITTRMEAMISAFSSSEQLAQAVASYGEQEDAFLSTTTAFPNSQADTPLAIVGIRIGDVHLVPGQRYLMNDVLPGGTEFAVEFNNNLTGQTGNNVLIGTSMQTITDNSVTITDNEVNADIPSGRTFGESETLNYISVKTDRGLYFCMFYQ